MAVTGIETDAGIELWNVEDYGGGVTNETDPYLTPMVQYYTHFDLSTEQLGHTWRYNCWGFTFLPRRYWINSSSCVDQIINDNCTPVAAGSVQRGDVIRYRDDAGVTTHTGRVWAVDGSGNCTQVRSKWGNMGEYVHIPLEPYITPYYGTNLAYFRQHAPLKGIIGDLWVMGTPGDTGEQYGDTGWTSPDIIVDAPPYGSVDVNPVFGVVNRVWAEVRNRSEATISDARVRYYWADPYAGFAASNWQLIPGTASHPNPTNTFSVPGYSSVTAPYVEWTPAAVPGVPDPAHQCLLAVVYVNDDPQDSTNPDPIVYPFDIRWDNNIAARNVHVVSMKKGSSTKLELFTGIPFDGVGDMVAGLRVSLHYVPRFPLIGFPTARVVAPKVKVAIGRQRALSLVAPRYTAIKAPYIRKTEMLVGRRDFRRVRLTAKEPVPIKLGISMPRTVSSGSGFYIRIQQVYQGEVTGAYTVAIAVI